MLKSYLLFSVFLVVSLDSFFVSPQEKQQLEKCKKQWVEQANQLVNLLKSGSDLLSGKGLESAIRHFQALEQTENGLKKTNKQIDTKWKALVDREFSHLNVEEKSVLNNALKEVRDLLSRQENQKSPAQ